MDKLTIGIIFGGVSEEHDISVKSALEVAAHLDLSKYSPVWIGITKTGAWTLCEAPREGWDNGSGPQVALSPDRSTHGLLVLDGEQYSTITLDVVFPVLHGTLGEDGAIQGLLELSALPYVGCGIQASVLAMDKSLAYTVARSAGISTPGYWVAEPHDEIHPDQYSYPVFVKPARSGSSFGVSKVDDKQQLLKAVEVAREFDSTVLIEEAIIGDEIGCAMLGAGRDFLVGEPDRVALTSGFFRIHQEAKPEQGSANSTFVVPADISPENRGGGGGPPPPETVYRALGCRGLARVDMFLKHDGTIVLNEVNTLPGLTSYSRYPRMMAVAGITLSEIIDRLVAVALGGGER